MARKIALLGTAPSGCHAPFDDYSWEIWGVSARCHYVTRADRWYELHRLDGEPKQWADNWRKEMREWLSKEAALPLYMFYPESLGPNVQPYPLQEIQARFGTFFMTSTFAWMAAHAIHEICPMVDGRPTIAPEGTELGVWGVDMEYGTEYKDQRAGVRHFLSLAQQLGFKVRRLVTGGLTYEPIPYPLWQDDPLLNKLNSRYQNACDEAERVQKTLIESRQIYNETMGAVKELELQLKERIVAEDYAEPVYDPAKRLELLRDSLKAKEELGNRISDNLTALKAIKGEQEWLMDYLKP